MHLINMKFYIVISLCASLVWASSYKVSEHASIQKNTGARIIGGQLARAGQFPFAAAVYIQTLDSTTFCGGALISNLWILTAAHCIDGAILATVHLGSNVLQGSDSNRLTLATDNFVIYPLFDKVTLEHDIGLIMFRLPVTFTEYIKSTSFFPIVDLPGSASTTTFGWGQISDDVAGLTNELQYVELSTLSNDECKRVFGAQITDNMVCVDGNYNEGICRGDSGSPLIQNIAGGNTLIVGIGSFISTNGCESTEPSGFTRVFPYKPWISNVTGVL